jgi:hypothetical protein
MRRRKIMLSTAVLLAASMVVGQADGPGSNYEHLEKIEWLIGEMEWTSEAEDDVPGVCEKGDKLCGWAEHEWVLNKNAIEVHVKIKTATEGKEVLAYRGMIGWDAKEGKIVSAGFDSTGGRGMSTWVQDGDSWSLKGKGCNGEGKETSSTLIVAKVDDNHISIHTVDRWEGGEKLPDGVRVVCTRLSDDDDGDDDDDD